MNKKLFYLFYLFLIVISFQSLKSQNRAPSCWLNYQDYYPGDIIINTIRVKSPSPLYTYYCALQWNAGMEAGGYCGIQEHPNGRNFIYSIWDPISSQDTIMAAYKHSGTEVENFGGEGTGLKSWNFAIGWESDQWYTFVSRSWNYLGHTMFGFWVYDHTNSTWYHIVTMDFPVYNVKFNSPTGSFIEDWFGNGWDIREVHHREGWKRKASNKSWHPFTSAFFTRVSPDPGANNYINNYDGGVDQNFYFMKSGGNASPVTNPSGTYLSLSNNNIEPVFQKGELTDVNLEVQNNLLYLSWQTDSTTLPQYSYCVRIFDNPEFSGNALLEISENIPHIRTDTINLIDIPLLDKYYLQLNIKDIFDNESEIILKSFVVPNFTVTALTNPINGGWVNGAGSFIYGQNCTLTSTNSSGYEFIYWTEGSEIVSYDEIYSFSVFDNIILTANFENICCEQQVLLSIGWSGISSYIVPDDPNIQNIFTPVQDELVILQNFEGLYWPTAGVNTLINWDDHNGYQIKMETAQQVTFSGSMQDNLTANLIAGWNYLPVLNACDNDAELLFNQISDHLQIVKDVAGTGVYWPQLGINTLGSISPGKAYFILVDEAVSLEFSSCDKQDLTSFENLSGLKEGETLTGFETLSGLATGDYPSPTPTPVTHTIAIPASAAAGLNEGDVIRVLNDRGMVTGAMVYHAGNNVLTAFGDDPTTPAVDGMTSGEQIRMEILNPDSGKAFPLQVTWAAHMPHGGNFAAHGISAIDAMQVTGMSGEESLKSNVAVHPNPSKGRFSITTGLRDFVWEVTDIHGSSLLTGNDQSEAFSIDLTSHPKGIYYLMITKGGLQVVKKLVVQ